MKFACLQMHLGHWIVGLATLHFTGCGVVSNQLTIACPRHNVAKLEHTPDLASPRTIPSSPNEGSPQRPSDSTPDRIVASPSYSLVVAASGIDIHSSQAASPIPAVVGAVDIPTSPEAMTFEELERLAFDNNPTLREIGASIDAAYGIRYQVGSPANPTLGYFGSQIGAAGTDQHGVYIDQELVRGGKLQLNQRLLDQSICRLRQEWEVQRYRISTDIRLLFLDALAAQRTAQLCAEFKNTMQTGVQMAEVRKRVGEGTQLEILQVQIQLSEVELVEQQAQQLLRGTWNEMVAMAGIPDLPPQPLAEFADEVMDLESFNIRVETILAGSPELAAARACVAESRVALDRQRVQSTPNLNVQFGAGVDNGTGSNMINLQIGAPLPVFNNNSGNIQAAQAEFHRAHQELRRLELSLRVRYARVAQELQSAKVASQQFQDSILPRARQALSLADIAYQAGELEFLQLLVARRTYFESNLQSISAERNLSKAQAQLDGMLLTGGLDAPNPLVRDDAIRGQSFGGQ